MFRAVFRKVEATDVSFFADSLSFLAAVDLYYLLPPGLHLFGDPKSDWDLLWEVPELFLMDRFFLACIAYFILRRLIKMTLLRVLELNSPAPR